MRDLVINPVHHRRRRRGGDRDWFASAGEDDPRSTPRSLLSVTHPTGSSSVGRRSSGCASLGPEDRRHHRRHSASERVAKYVVSSTLTDPDWANSEVLGGDLRAAIADITSRPGGDIVCTGSIRLCHDLLAMDLVDELRLFTYPTSGDMGVACSTGAGAPVDTMEVTTFPSGVVFLSRYRRA